MGCWVPIPSAGLAGSAIRPSGGRFRWRSVATCLRSRAVVPPYVGPRGNGKDDDNQWDDERDDDGPDDDDTDDERDERDERDD